uniref:NADH dehydrogenase [ubiquinone] 1 alpha subcomplex subunit 5 n=1 Tax=Laticauda laticaudata TaxID=8630 RepID=A0A8C5S5K7_LATLA
HVSSYLQTTGLVGLAVCNNPHESLKLLYTKILGILESMPQDAAYRKYTEKLTNERFDIVKAESDVQRLENKLNSGQIEEVILQVFSNDLLQPLSHCTNGWKEDV